MSDKIAELAKRIIASGYEYSGGGKIHIKPENRGKFTALKERTGHSATWFKEHGTPSQKKMAVFALNAAKWKHGDGGFILSFDIGGPAVDPNSPDKDSFVYPTYTQQWGKKLPPELQVEIPYAVPKYYRLPSSDGSLLIPGFENETSAGYTGAVYYNLKHKTPWIKYYRNPSGELFTWDTRRNPNVNVAGYEEISADEARAMLPRKDYIGGENYRLETAKKIPGFIDTIREKAALYGIDPNLLLHRTLREGFIDMVVDEYNNMIPASQQKTFFDDVMRRPVSGFNAFGLDDAGSNLLSGKYSLKTPSVTWELLTAHNEKGREVQSVVTSNVSDALEIKAADMAYRQQELAKRGLVGNKYVNAAYNAGLNSPHLTDEAYMANHYGVPEYGVFSKGGNIHKYDGKTESTGYLQNPYSDKYAAGLAYNVPEYEPGQYVLSIDEEGATPVSSGTKPSTAPISARSSDDAVSFVPPEEAAVPWDSYADSYTKPFGTTLPDDLVSFPVQYGQRLTTGSGKQASAPSSRGFLRDVTSLDHEKLSALPSQRDATDTVVGPINPEKDLVANPMSLDVSLLTRSDISGDSFEKVAGDYLSSLTAEEKKSLQKELFEQGWLDTKQTVSLSGIRQKSEEAYAIQRKLKSLGYDLGTYGPNHDGVDGNIGRKTRAAFARYKEEHPNSAEESLLDLGKIKTSDTEKALAKRLSFFSEHGPSSDKTGPGVADSSYGEENIGTHYDKKFDDYKIGGFDVSNIYNVPISKNNSGTSPLSFTEFPKTAPSKECASAVTMFFVKNFGGKFVDKYNLRGDAWTMGSNIEQAGGKRIFNLFDDEGAPRVNNKDVTISYVRSRAKDKEYKDFLTENLSVGNVVELLYPNSNKFSKAYEESNGHNQNTHIGMIVERGGELYVLDNSGGNYHATPLSTVISGKERRGVLITGAVSVNDGTDPRFNTDSEVFVADMKDLGVTPNEKYNNQLKEEGSTGIKYYNYNNEAAYREMAALKRNAKKLMSDYELSTDEFNKIAALTHAASMAETRNGSLAPGRKFKAESGNITVREGAGPLLQLLGRYTLPNLSEAVSSRIRALEQSGQLLRGEEPTTDSVLDAWPLRTVFKPVSRGLANVKPGYHYTIYEQQHLPIEGNRAEQPESSAVMGFLTIAKNYKHIKERLSGTEFGKDEGLIMALTALSHNQGLKNIDINIDKYLETGDKEELLQYTYREKEYKEALERQDKEAAKYYKGPGYSRMLLDFMKYNNYKIVS